MTTRVAIAGCTGKMGRMLVEATLAAPDLKLTVALDRPDSPELGTDCAAFLGRASGVRVGADLAALRDSDVLIDFTRPEATPAHLAACVGAGTALVLGTTGFDDAGRRAIETAATRIPVLASPNMSVGVNAMIRLVELAAKLLDDAYDVEIIEAHHRHKVDAPSGTALALGREVAQARGVDFDQVSVLARSGITGPRPRGAIGFAAIRGGDVIGDHTVLFAADGERIELTHKSSSRSSYAQGALRAARFVVARPAGLYAMRDALGAA